MGGYLDKPKTNIHNDQGRGNNLRYAVSCMQGWRTAMEDAYFASVGISEGYDDWSYFAIFDGHSGFNVSRHCAKHLLESILVTEEFKSGDYENGIRNGFLNLDENMRKLYLCGGTTAVCAFVSPTHVYIANCGDSRAVLSRDGKPVLCTQDHKPILPVEEDRIKKAGGSVMTKRVNGALAVSRALGDYEYKCVKGKTQCEQLVSPEPEVFCQSIQDSDEFIVLACDGIWDVMTNEDVCSFIHSRLKIISDLFVVADELIKTCLNKGSRDNMSVIIIAFPGAPKICEKAQEAEKRLDEELEKIIKEEIALSDNKKYNDLLAALRDKNIEGLPPGGGLHAKYCLIKRIYENIVGPDKNCEVRNYFYNC